MALNYQHSRKAHEEKGVTSKASSTISAYSRWHAYPLEERHAAWKVLLPISSEAAILAIGLKGSDLASLGRSWKLVHVYKCADSDLEWAAKQAQSLGQEYEFERVRSFGAAKARYSAIAISAESISACDPRKALRLLEPGGAVAWIGPRKFVPSVLALVKQGYLSVRRYAILPPSTGKILVPLEDRSSTLAGLSLFKPLKWRNRLPLWIGRVATRVGAQSLLGVNQFVMARKSGRLADSGYLLDWLGSQMERPVADASIYAGWTKMVLQLFDEHGQVLGFAKVADTPFGRQAIKRESASLRRLETVADLQESVPRIQATGEWRGHGIQIQTVVCPCRTTYTTKLTHAHLKFLTALSQVDQCEMTLEQWPHWAVLWRWAHEGEFSSAREAEAVRLAVERCADRLGNRKMIFHRVHGDFTPWHALLGPNGLIVVDWEHSEAVGLPLCDAVHFTLKRHNHPENRDLSIERLLTRSALILRIDQELNRLASSLHLHPEIARLATVYACMVSICPLLRFIRWNQ